MRNCKVQICTKGFTDVTSFREGSNNYFVANPQPQEHNQKKLVASERKSSLNPDEIIQYLYNTIYLQYVHCNLHDV